MKQILALLLALAMVCSLAACGSEPEAPAEQTAGTSGEDSGETSGETITVANVEELLAAIGSNREIELAAGEFLLSGTENYGKSGGSDSFLWNDLGLGEYELQIQNVENLTIRGAGADQTNLSTDSRWANVLSLVNCKNVTLEAMTLGHTEMTQPCEGGVIRMEGCQNTALKDLGLYGCGTLGLQTYSCQTVAVANCSIYDCSIGGVQINQTSDVAITDSTFRSLGKEMPVALVFDIGSSEDVTISGCTISDNYVNQLALVANSTGVAFRNNHFQSTQISQYAFDFQSEVVWDSNTFEDTEPRIWYAGSSLPAVDAGGAEVIFEEPASETVAVTPGVATPVSTGEQKEVRVKTVDEFIQALAPDTCIILEGELFDFSQASGYGTSKGDYYYWVENYDGPGLVICNLSNLTIKAEGEDRKAHTLSAVPRYADVLTFENCSAITVSGFTAGHTVEQGDCTGGVLLFRNSEDILVENCGLYGCGTEGVNGEYSKNIQVVNSEIYECSYTGIELNNCENVAISGTLIRDIKNDWGDPTFFRFYGNKNVTLDGQPMDGNYVGN